MFRKEYPWTSRFLEAARALFSDFLERYTILTLGERFGALLERFFLDFRDFATPHLLATDASKVILPPPGDLITFDTIQTLISICQ